MSKKKFLVTGASGFIGANLVRRLVTDEQEVHIFLRTTSPTWRIADILPKISVHRVDLRDATGVQQAVWHIQPQVIFHCAAAGIHGGHPDADARGMMETSLFGTMNLIDACADLDYECFVNTGSSSEYGPKVAPMKESDICEPITAYGVAKCAATLYGSYIGKIKKKPILGFRIFSPFGPYDDKDRFIVYAMLQMLRGQNLACGDPHSVRDYYYIDDAVDCYLAATDRAKDYCGEIFNIGSGHETPTGEVIEILRELSGFQGEVSWNKVAGRSFDSEHWRADISKTSHAFVWRPRYTLKEGLQTTAAWFKDGGLDFYKI